MDRCCSILSFYREELIYHRWCHPHRTFVYIRGLLLTETSPAPL